MLILTRKVNESIVIADNIVVTLLNVKGGQAKIGIVAPREIDVHREEVFNKIQDSLKQEPPNQHKNSKTLKDCDETAN